jgi:hypothetical protein
MSNYSEQQQHEEEVTNSKAAAIVPKKRTRKQPQRQYHRPTKKRYKKGSVVGWWLPPVVVFLDTVAKTIGQAEGRISSGSVKNRSCNSRFRTNIRCKCKLEGHYEPLSIMVMVAVREQVQQQR